MAWGMSAAVNATESALATGAEEEFRAPGMPPPGAVRAAAGCGEREVPEPLLPRRIPVAALPNGPRHDAADDAAAASPESPVPRATGTRPDLNLLAQVLRGLQRMA